ncbi:MAG: acyl-CoA dehydrogenase [Nocardioides sp.]|nr:acyl-CoA dehydrogenase [Nocardioides sp.]
MSEIVQRRDIDFVLFEMLGLEDLFRHDYFAAHDRETVSAVLDTAEAIAEDHFLPLAPVLDAEEPQFVDGKVVMPQEAATALAAYADAGMFGMSFSEADGGLQLPYVISVLANGIFAAANVSLANYANLTVANANLLSVFCTPAQKAKYLPAMLEGRCFGTMCLSEPQAGSSLSDITTKATPRADGLYNISGSKMWISGGDHELSDNILHLVLAKIPGGAPGVKGISLFMVPRYLIGENGAKGAWNNVSLAGLNHKMGQRGCVNCLLNFGEDGDCVGEIVGEPGKGLSYMFHMMNEARIFVGQSAAMLGLAGYLHSLHYAKERAQGRHPHNKDPLAPQVPIIEHADVKRMLIAQKASVEGAMALIAYSAMLIDRQTVTEDPDEKAELGLLLDILTPVVKSWPSEFCLEANKLAIQILGGYGYTRDYPVERIYRDNRLNPIHEGTHGIQGIDLLGRKVRMHDGAALKQLAKRIRQTIAEARDLDGLDAEAVALERALAVAIEVTDRVVSARDVNLSLANATIYLDAFGHVVIAWIWLWQAVSAARALPAASEADVAFYRGKTSTCRYFFRYELPKVFAQFELVAALDDTCFNFEAEQFGAVA